MIKHDPFMTGRPNQSCKGQSSFYDKLLVLRRLTDRQIRKYEREGRYGPEAQVRALRPKSKNGSGKSNNSFINAVNELLK